MAKNNRATTTDTPAPTPVRISYIHPVVLLRHRLPNALIAVSAIPYGEKSLHPALRAIELATGVAFGIGKLLRFGMGDRAGVIETELRTGLDALHLGAYGVSRDAPPVVKRQCWDAYDQLEQLYTKLSRVATEPEPIPWSKKLRGFYNALLRVKDGMRTLYEAAEDDAKDPVELWKQVCRTVLPDFSEVAADILPQLVYAAEADGSGDLYLDRFPDHVFNCCQELMCWGTNRRERPKEGIRFEPSHEYRAARADREALLWWIENAPEAVEAEPSSEGKKSAAQLAGAVPEDDREAAATLSQGGAGSRPPEFPQPLSLPAGHVTPPSPYTISNRKAAKLFAKWTGTKPDAARIRKLIRNKDPRFPVEKDGRTTEDGVAVLAAHILKKRRGHERVQNAHYEQNWKETCPNCGKRTYRLIGAAKECPKCFEERISSLDS